MLRAVGAAELRTLEGLPLPRRRIAHVRLPAEQHRVQEQQLRRARLLAVARGPREVVAVEVGREVPARVHAAVGDLRVDAGAPVMVACDHVERQVAELLAGVDLLEGVVEARGVDARDAVGVEVVAAGWGGYP